MVEPELAIRRGGIVMVGAVAAIAVLYAPWKDSAPWWLLAALLMPVWIGLLNLPWEVFVFAAGFTLIVSAKRITSNDLNVSGKGWRALLK